MILDNLNNVNIQGFNNFEMGNCNTMEIACLSGSDQCDIKMDDGQLKEADRSIKHAIGVDREESTEAKGPLDLQHNVSMDEDNIPNVDH